MANQFAWFNRPSILLVRAIIRSYQRKSAAYFVRRRRSFVLTLLLLAPLLAMPSIVLVPFEMLARAQVDTMLRALLVFSSVTIFWGWFDVQLTFAIMPSDIDPIVSTSSLAGWRAKLYDALTHILVSWPILLITVYSLTAPGATVLRSTIILAIAGAAHTLSTRFTEGWLAATCALISITIFDRHAWAGPTDMAIVILLILAGIIIYGTRRWELSRIFSRTGKRAAGVLARTFPIFAFGARQVFSIYRGLLLSRLTLSAGWLSTIAIMERYPENRAYREEIFAIGLLCAFLPLISAMHAIVDSQTNGDWAIRCTSNGRHLASSRSTLIGMVTVVLSIIYIAATGNVMDLSKLSIAILVGLIFANALWLVILTVADGPRWLYYVSTLVVLSPSLLV